MLVVCLLGSLVHPGAEAPGQLRGQRGQHSAPASGSNGPVSVLASVSPFPASCSPSVLCAYVSSLYLPSNVASLTPTPGFASHPRCSDSTSVSRWGSSRRLAWVSVLSGGVSGLPRTSHFPREELRPVCAAPRGLPLPLQPVLWTSGLGSFLLPVPSSCPPARPPEPVGGLFLQLTGSSSRSVPSLPRPLPLSQERGAVRESQIVPTCAQASSRPKQCHWHLRESGAPRQTLAMPCLVQRGAWSVAIRRVVSAVVMVTLGLQWLHSYWVAIHPQGLTQQVAPMLGTGTPAPSRTRASLASSCPPVARRQGPVGVPVASGAPCCASRGSRTVPCGSSGRPVLGCSGTGSSWFEMYKDSNKGGERPNPWPSRETPCLSGISKTLRRHRAGGRGRGGRGLRAGERCPPGQSCPC